MTAPLMLLDAASLWYRAFHALPEKLTAPDGRPVNAVRGFTDMVSALITQEQPSRLAVCLDLDWRPKFRTDLVPSYKAHRVSPDNPLAEDAPASLGPQVPMIMDVLAAAGIATAGARGYEADDVMGTLAARESVDPVLVVSGDRDLLQVVRDGEAPVRVLYVGRGLAKAERFGPAEVAAKYGVPVEGAGQAYVEMALLRGDPSDGLPGVAGVGDKTASKLILEYGTLERLRAAVADPDSALAARVRAKLVDARTYLDAGLPVVEVATDADVVLSKPDALPTTPVDPGRLAQLAEELGIERVVDRLILALASRLTS
ncbi:5'-3' exonuclease [Tomitella biformata]|uniref:5'-3' exonuclease n=1 Tax=Tomitella biformata TaxID=630403 RepID=UPI000464A856|nr:5'-3' exonuclease [Tomitella biformata]